MNQRERFDKLSDRELIELFQRNADNEFLGALFNRYTHLVYGVCLKYLKERESAKDAVMDIFEGLLKSLGHQEIKNFGAWIHVVARNHCLMKLRKKEILLRNEDRDQIFMETPDDLHHNNEEVIGEADLSKLEEGISQLPKEQMDCIRLFYLEQRSYAEIATRTGYELKKVKSYIQNGKRNLRNWLDKKIE